MQIHEKQRDLENAQLYVEEAQSEGRHESGDPFCVLILCTQFGGMFLFDWKKCSKLQNIGRKKCCKLYDIAQKKCDKLYVTKKSIVTK
ncbi:MAG TPA: hypothetical protein DCG10_11430 [Lachnospiraceae bacterium]|nr:hypothetical protein [Lachnospiraceae bacterium]